MSSQAPPLFIETNVWFSAFYGSINCEILIKAHLEGKIVAVVSRQVLRELVHNIHQKIPHALPALKKLIAASPPMTIADPERVDPRIGGLIHPKDRKVFSSLLGVKRVTCFITGNAKHFSIPALKKTTGITVLTPRQAVEQFGL